MAHINNKLAQLKAVAKVINGDFVKHVKLGVMGLMLAMGVSVMTSNSANAQTLNQDVAPAIKHSFEHDNSLVGQELAVALSIAPPFVMIKDSLANPVGIDVELIQELQRRTGFVIKNDRMHINNFAFILKQGAQGNFDIIGGGATLSEERAHQFDMTAPSVTTRLGVYTNEDHPQITDINQLKGLVVAQEYGTDLSKVLGVDVKVKETATNFLSFYKVNQGKADALVADLPLGHIYDNTWQDGDIKLQFIIENSESNMGLLLKKDSPYSDVLSRVFDEMVKDGTVERIVRKYINHDCGEGALVLSANKI